MDVREAEGGSCPGNTWQSHLGLMFSKMLPGGTGATGIVSFRKAEEQLKCGISEGPVRVAAGNKSWELQNAPAVGDVRRGLFPCLSAPGVKKEKKTPQLVSVGVGVGLCQRKRQPGKFINGNAWKSWGGLK